MEFNAFLKLISPIKHKLQLMVGRAVLKATTDTDGRLMIKANLLADETHDGLEVFQHYGYASRPLKECEIITVAVGGHRNGSIGIATEDRRHRPKTLKEGEIQIYDDQGQIITIYRDRIEVEAPKVVVKSDNIHLGSEGGPQVARIGDHVQVGGGSSAGLWPIVEGSEKVRAT